jgi:hypothetical protein
MAADQRNPFDPDLDGAALRLTFDSRSLRSLSGDRRSEAEFLLSLAHTEKIDGLVVWAEEGFAPDLPAAEMLPGRGISTVSASASTASPRLSGRSH